MAEAVFSISADITPVLDDQALQQQAQALSKQLNGLLAKQVNKVSLAPAQGSFRPFQQEVTAATSILDKFHQVAAKLPITKVAKEGSNAFLKFTDVIDVTRRDLVGYGNSLFDTVRNTHRFRDALDGIKAAGSSISDLPGRFQILSAQIQSGTSVVDRFAAKGNVMAQLFQPVVRQGEAARTEFVNINATLDRLTRAFSLFASASGKLDATRNDFDLLGKTVNNLEKPFFRVQAILNQAGLSSTKFGQELRATFAGAAGDPAALVSALVALRDQAQKVAGPIGLINQALGNVSAAERDTAKATRLELNAALIELGHGDKVVGIQKIATEFALTRARVESFVGFFAPAGRVISQFGAQARTSISSIGNSITSGLLGRFPQFSNEALSATESMNKFVGGASNFDIAAGRIQNSINSVAKSLGSFLGKNLTGPLQSGINDLKTESTRLGTEIVTGLGKGIQNGKAVLTRATSGIFDTVLGGIKKLFGIASPATAMIPPGQEVAAGFAKGINQGKGQVNTAIAGLASGLSSLKNSISQFSKSAITVAAGAFGALAGVALHTGIEFNTLQQVVHGTLPVLVGSARASDELLASVNKLNDSSPFARSSFLELTQTLAGFGVQAKKIPDLIDAIQQTIAATGGSSADLQELGGAFARIQSQGRLSLDVLQSFSSRGVDAIGILGKQMGKTQSEIRDMISNGLVPADKAIDILTKGLKDKFNGATEAVAKNLPGALDRVHAKLRDLGAAVTSAFVNPTGGGALVDFLNHISNAIKHITTDIIPPLQPLLILLGQAFAAVGAKVEQFSKSISASSIPHFVDQIANIAPALAGLLGFFPKLLSFIPGFGPLLANLGGPFTAFALVLGTIAARSDTVRAALAPVLDSFQNLARVVSPIIQNILPQLEALIARVVSALAPFIARVANEAVPFIKQLGDVLSGLIGNIGPVVDAFGRLLASLNPALFFQILGVLLNVSKAFAPIAGALTQMINLLAKIGPILTVLLARFVAMKAAEAIIGFLKTGVKALADGLLALAIKIPIVQGALQALALSAEATAAAMNLVVPIIGLIAAGVGAFLLLKHHSDDAATSIQKLGDASVSTKDKLKVLFGTADLDKFKVSLQDIKAAADEANASLAADPTNPDAVQAAADAVASLSLAEEDRAKAIKNATLAGEKGLSAEAKQQIALIQDAQFRSELNAAVDKGVESQARANALSDESTNILQKATDKLKAQTESHKTLKQVAEESAKAIQDNYSAASKVVEDAQTKMSGAIDSLKQGLSTIDQKLNPLFSAAQAVRTTAQAVVDANLTMAQAQTKQSDDSIAFTRLLRDQAHALQDVIKPVDELAVAERNLTRIQNSLRDSQRQLDDMAIERAKLTGQQAADDRAGLARAEERAVINLNKAKQAQLDLENELNNAGKISVDLTGLSLDQIRAKLATARNQAQAQGKQRKQTAQEIADARESAKLDIADATQGVTDSKNASLQFEIDNKKKIRDIDDQSAAIVADMADKQLEIGTALVGISRLRAGENQLAAVTLDFDEKIRDAKRTTVDDTRAIESASRGIQTATQAARLAGLDLQLQSATIRQDTGAIASFQQQIWKEKEVGLTFDARTQTAVDTLKGSVSSLLKDYQNITAEVQKALKLQATASTLQGAGSALTSFESLNNTINDTIARGGAETPLFIKSIQKLETVKNDTINQIKSALSAGAGEDKTTKQSRIPSVAEINAIATEIQNSKATLRDAIRDALNHHNLSMPGFAAARGLSPGMIHRGMHDGKGLVRMFEYGKEAVLPLTRPTDMARIVGDPSVLPAILNALPGFARGFAPGDIIANALSTPNNALRELLQDLFRSLGLQFPGFAEGYAPGDTISAPSMKPFSLANSMPVTPLSSVLNALPRWSRPEASVTSSTEATDLVDIVRSARSSGGPANADVYEKKNQREFAGTIGEAVKAAMTEAIASGDLGGGNHADIHVNPSATETQRAIAREVKRQLDKRTGKW